jgi:hypothetical protein
MSAVPERGSSDVFNAIHPLAVEFLGILGGEGPVPS